MKKGGTAAYALFWDEDGTWGHIPRLQPLRPIPFVTHWYVWQFHVSLIQGGRLIRRPNKGQGT